MKSADVILWLDLETTGTDPGRDAILEVGGVLTTADPLLREIGWFDWVVVPPAGALDAMADEVLAMHTTSGLLDDLARGRGVQLDHVDRACARWVSTLAKTRPAVGGSNVSFDLDFARRQLPKLYAALDASMVFDVAVVRRTFDVIGRRVSSDPKLHRALACAQRAVREARAYLVCFDA